MNQDFSSSPVMVMLSIRYTNGITMSFAARAIAVEEKCVRIVTMEDLEDGIHVGLSAPFLKDLAQCYVARKSRSQEWPGYVEIELRYYEKPPELAIGDVVKRAGGGLILDQVDAGIACHELADLLENGSEFSFSRIVHSSPPSRRLLYCAASAVAVMLQLQDNYAFDYRALIDELRQSDAHAPSPSGRVQ